MVKHTGEGMFECSECGWELCLVDLCAYSRLAEVQNLFACKEHKVFTSKTLDYFNVFCIYLFCAYNKHLRTHTGDILFI